MYSRFTNIVNDLKSLGKYISNIELANKILRSLPSSWDAKVTAIQEAKDVDALPIEQLIGSLMTYELSMQQKVLENEKGKKIVTLKSITNDEELDEGDKDDEVAFLSRKFRKFMKKSMNIRRSTSTRKWQHGVIARTLVPVKKKRLPTYASWLMRMR